MAVSPEEISQGTQIVEAVIPLVKWMGGTIAAAYIAVRWTLRQGVLVGEEKQRYKDLVRAVDKLNAIDMEALVISVAELKAAAPLWITKPQHDDMTKFCTGEIERMVEAKMYRAIMEWRDELAALNANVCHIMGALNLRPVDQGQRRRRSDVEAGD